MKSDITINDYYRSFIHNQTIKKNELISEINKTDVKINELHEYLESCKDNIAIQFDLDLGKYKIEWEKKRNSTAGSLYHKVLKLLDAYKFHSDKIQLIQLLKYCKEVIINTRAKDNLRIVEKECNFTRNDYREFVMKYYNTVHKVILLGMGYKVGRLGALSINRWVRNISEDVYHRIDFNETNKRRKELIEKGLEPYSKEKARWCKERNIKYDGIKYWVFKKNPAYYQYMFVGKRAIRKNILKFLLPVKTLSDKYRKYSTEELAKLFKTDDEIFQSQMSLSYKLVVYLKKYPENYTNYVRNPEQRQHKRRKNNRKNR